MLSIFEYILVDFWLGCSNDKCQVLFLALIFLPQTFLFFWWSHYEAIQQSKRPYLTVKRLHLNKNWLLVGLFFSTTGCLNAKPDVLNTYYAIKRAFLSHKNSICTFMRCGNLTYDPWIWLKITSLSSTASVLKDGRISLEIPSFHSEIFCSKTSK